MTDKINEMKFQDLRAYARELEKKLAGVQEVAPLAPEDDDVAALKAELHELKAEREGWLITTPNVLYGGVTCGVRFEHGMAFVPKNREFPNRKVTPLKDTYYQKYKLSEEEKSAIKAREARSTAQIVVDELTHEFNYTAEYFDVARLDQMKALREARNKEFQAAYEVAKSAEAAGKLAAPGYVGG